MARVGNPDAAGHLRFLQGFADSALMPAVQALLINDSSEQVKGRILATISHLCNSAM